MTAPKKPRPPMHLEAATRAWFGAVCADYSLEPHHIRLLTLACEAWDRCSQARELLTRDGLVVPTADGGLKAHPAVGIERDCRLAFARLVRELDLDVEAPASERSGPPSLLSIRR